jgi:hypothetical protein
MEARQVASGSTIKIMVVMAHPEGDPSARGLEQALMGVEQ